MAVVKDTRLRSIIILAVNTMMRAGEIVNLQWENVDYKQGFIHLVNREDFILKGKRCRSIPLNQNAIRALEALRSDEIFVCQHERGLKKGVSSVSRRFKKMVRKAGLPDEIHFHTLRHTGATWLIQMGVPPPYIQKIMGHSTIATTMVYTQRVDEYLKAAVNQFDSIFMN